MIAGEFKRLLAACGYPQRSIAPVVIAQSGVPVSVTGTTAETTLATITIPANAVGPNGKLRIKARFTSTLDGTNTETFRIRLAGNNMFSSGNVTSVSTYLALTDISNNGVTNAQTGDPLIAGGGGTLTTATVDMTQAQTLTITGQLASGTDTITLVNYTVEVLNP